MMTTRKLLARVLPAIVMGLCLIAAGCGFGDFNEGRCRNSIEAAPVRLDGEQVILKSDQIDCGVHNDLWDAATYDPKELGVARLTAAGRALKFDDDIQINEVGNRQPYVQIRGEFPLQVLEILNIRDGDDVDLKLVEVRVGVVVQHSCFPQPLPLMGVRKGKFSQDMNPVIRLKQQGNSWFVDRFVH